MGNDVTMLPVSLGQELVLIASSPAPAPPSIGRAAGLAIACRTLVVLALLALATASLYFLGLSGGFIFDDFPNIVDNRLVQPNSASVADLVAAALSSPSSELKRPLASLSFAANYLTSGLNPEAMKATNLALHIINGWLAYLLLLALTRRAASPVRAWLYPAVLAFVWLALPINLTAVLYVVQRMESMANLFVLAGLLGYVRVRSEPNPGRLHVVHAALWVTVPVVLGVLAKETAVLLPLYALCVEACVLHYRTADGTRRPGFSVMYALILGVPIAVAMIWIGPSLIRPGTWATRDFTLGTRLLSEPRAVLDYLVWTIAPFPSGLSFYHDDFQVSTSPFNPWTTLPAMACVGSLALAGWLLRKRLPLFTLGVAWFFACQTLTATVLPLELVYEHRNYFASLGIVLAFGELCVFALHCATRPLIRGLAMVAVALLIAWSAGLTFVTATAWGSPMGLAEELARRGPESSRAQYELGRAYIIASHYDPNSPYTRMAVAPLESAAKLPGASILAEQALIFLYSRARLQVQDAWWASIITKLRARSPTVQDESALGALSQCVGEQLCKLNTARLEEAFETAMDHPGSSARLCAMYADFAASTLTMPDLALRLNREAVQRSPTEPAYRLSLGRRAAALGDRPTVQEQIDALRHLNFAGRLDQDIAGLERSLRNNGVTTEVPGHP